MITYEQYEQHFRHLSGLLPLRRIVSMATTHDATNAEAVHLLCNDEVVHEDASSVQSCDECLAEGCDDLMCLQCLEDSCTMITYEQYDQHFRYLSEHLAHMSLDSMEVTFDDIDVCYLESKEDEIETEEQLMSTIHHGALIVEKLIEEGLFIVVRQAVLPENRIIANREYHFSF
jgi:hypothetical protein